VTPQASPSLEARAGGGAKDRIVETAYALFCRHGIRAVGIDRIVAEAEVAKMTLYRHFASKDDLVIEILAQREQRWTRDWLQAETERRAKAPGDRLLVVFDVLDGWFEAPGYEGCTFIRTVMEFHDPEVPAHKEAARHLEKIRELLQAYATEAGFGDPGTVSHQIHILMMGAIVAASGGDRRAALRARQAGELLLGAAR
jgi:AcrR family transcriptional regulator